jgi:hypothetical protein
MKFMFKKANKTKYSNILFVTFICRIVLRRKTYSHAKVSKYIVYLNGKSVFYGYILC